MPMNTHMAQVHEKVIIETGLAQRLFLVENPRHSERFLRKCATSIVERVFCDICISPCPY